MNINQRLVQYLIIQKKLYINLLFISKILNGYVNVFLKMVLFT